MHDLKSSHHLKSPLVSVPIQLRPFASWEIWNSYGFVNVVWKLIEQTVKQTLHNNFSKKQQLMSHVLVYAVNGF